MNPSLNREGSTGIFPFRIWIIEAWENAARSLWVDWVANTVGPSLSCERSRIANRSR
ncbi:MAG: hypothetical protein A4E42_00039 [Methanoregulaceae archaeon PtaU1.Bin222]|nr:MAG: hypothetical protein A4E42_00039 [Methanoregulaceae archaeon PtaU1.Bin222]